MVYLKLSSYISVNFNLNSVVFFKMAFWFVNQNRRKVKNDINTPERIGIKNKWVVKSESKYINKFIYFNEYVQLHYDYGRY